MIEFITYIYAATTLIVAVIMIAALIAGCSRYIHCLISVVISPITLCVFIWIFYNDHIKVKK